MVAPSGGASPPSVAAPAGTPFVAAPSNETDPERRAAAWANSNGAKVFVIAGGQNVGLYGRPLPDGPLTVRQIDFAENLNGSELRRQITDADAANLAGLRTIIQLRLPYAQITDAGLRSLAGLTSLRELDLSDTKITDAGLPQLAALTNLMQLRLNRTAVTDVGVEAIVRQLPQLTDDLQLDDTRITRAGLVHLQGLKQLRSLTMNGTNVADADIVE